MLSFLVFIFIASQKFAGESGEGKRTFHDSRAVANLKVTRTERDAGQKHRKVSTAPLATEAHQEIVDN